MTDKIQDFTVFPAIDLRQGRVVRLRQGDPRRQTVYSDEPAAAARRWLGAGASWLHVVNLDGAFGQEDAANQRALKSLLQAATRAGARVQFGGGLRTLEAISAAIEMGISRVVLGTAAVEQPEILEQALARFGPDRIAAGLDARDGIVQVRGWVESSGVTALQLAEHLAETGLQWLVFTDVARDGIGKGLNLAATRDLARATGLQVIASGGVKGLEDVQAARAADLAGVIVGRALYEGKLSLEQALKEGVSR